MKKHIKNFLGALFIVGSTFLLLEGVVRVTDPWGLSFFNDLIVMGNELFELDEARGYVIVDGHHRFSDWSLTIENGVRVTPDTNPDATCTFIMLGDSVTMGHGIDDDEVWVNQLAREFPEIHFINTAVTIYNSGNVRLNKQAFPDGDAYIYLMIANDIQPAIRPRDGAFPNDEPSNLPYLVRYVNFIMFGSEPESLEPNVLTEDHPWMQRFFTELDGILEGDDTWLITFEDYTLTQTLRDKGYALHAYAYPPHPISYVDNHLNAEGNREFAAAISPLIETIQAERCADN